MEVVVDTNSRAVVTPASNHLAATQVDRSNRTAEVMRRHLA